METPAVKHSQEGVQGVQEFKEYKEATFESGTLHKTRRA
jgi:hypothetical protein